MPVFLNLQLPVNRDTIGTDRLALTTEAPPSFSLVSQDTIGMVRLVSSLLQLSLSLPVHQDSTGIPQLQPVLEALPLQQSTRSTAANKDIIGMV